jgi:Rrf2 family transcriptional regulator, iron-sulfur cluster assembly transcription factor
MKLTAQQEYGLRCLLVLAKEPEGTCTIPVIAKLEGLSKPYVAKLMRTLLKGGLVQSLRGHEGGYRLIRHPKDIPLNMVMNALGGRLFSETFCNDHAGLRRSCVHNKSDCSMRTLWSVLDDAVQGVLMHMSLQELVGGDGSFQVLAQAERSRAIAFAVKR